MKKFYKLLFLFLTACSIQQDPKVPEPPVNVTEKVRAAEQVIESDLEIVWQDGSKPKIKSMPTFIYIGADWCVHCKFTENETFKDKRLINVLNKGTYPIKLNADSKIAQNIFEATGVTGIPLFILVSTKKEILYLQSGRTEAVDIALNVTMANMSERLKNLRSASQMLLDVLDKNK